MDHALPTTKHALVYAGVTFLISFPAMILFYNWLTAA